MLQDYPIAELSKGIYKNISKSGLHQAVVKTPILPFTDVIEWMTQRIDHESKTIFNLEETNVAKFQAILMNQLYHFK